MKQSYESLADMVLFVEVARCGSFRHAALRLDIPVATLSRRISLMEKRLGLQLLVRTTRSVSLAPAAKPYFEGCLRVVEAADAAQDALDSGAQAPERIRISAPVDLGHRILGPIIAAYVQATPGLRVDMDLSTQAKDLFRDPVDIVFRLGRPMDDRVVARKIWDVAAGLYASPDCLQRHGTPTTAKALETMPCLELVTANGPMPWRLSHGRWAKAPGAVKISANNMGLMVKLAAQGHGVALLPRHMASEWVDSGHLVEVLAQESTPAWSLYAITASRSMSSHMRGLTRHVRSALQDFRP